MSERQTINTNIRLNLANEDDRRAWEYLQTMDRKEFRSYSRAVVAALIDFFTRRERLTADPFLETRERQESFLQEVKETIQSSLQTPAAGIGALAALFQTAPPAVESQEMSEESYDAAMDFINQL